MTNERAAQTHAAEVNSLPAPEAAAEFAGVPDAFQRLWTPHRWVYIDGDAKPADESAGQCPFCGAPKKSDEEALIVHRGEYCFVLMNLFPYNAGHMLVIPYRHIADYTELTGPERIEFGELTATAMHALRLAAQPQGINLGMNQGNVAGAGIAGHLHQHVIPRWLGDANFLPIIAQTKTVPQLLGQARSQLAAVWEEAAKLAAACAEGK